MERVRMERAEERAHTDASLDAERASADAEEDLALTKAQRLADDLIERDRALADARILSSRASADGLLARERADTKLATGEGPSDDASRTAANQVLDHGKQAADARVDDERHRADALVDDERHRADALIEMGRRELNDARARMVARRHHTDDDLSAERNGADVSLNELSETRGALVVAQQEQGRRAEVLAMVTHDLRSPLTVIAMNAQSIQNSVDAGDNREAAEEVSLAAARMERLLVDLLDVVRIESGVFRIAKRPQDVDTFLAEVVRHYKPLFEARGLALVTEGIGARFLVAFDHDRMVQVLSNLLGNAMKFTPRGGTITLRATGTDAQVQFLVGDNGPGIRAADLPHVFERFWQTDGKRRRGLGLGLSICEKIVAEHGGRISAESTFGEGTTFQVSLPRTASAPD